MAVNIYLEAAKAIKKNSYGRKLILLEYENNDFNKYCAEVGLCFDKQFFVLHSQKASKSKASQELNKKNSEFYLVNTCDYPSGEQIKFLNELGYSERDYFFILHNPVVLTGPMNAPYADKWGNNLNYLPKNLSVIFEGFNNTVFIGENINVTQKSYIKVRNDNKVNIGSDILYNCDIICQEKLSECTIGSSVKFINKCAVVLYEKAVCKIGEFSTFSGPSSLFVYNKMAIQIGNDCMFAGKVSFLAGDGHAIFNIKTGERINSADKLSGDRNKLIIGNHVWLGVGVTVLNGADIGEGSIVGAGAIIKKKIPNNCIFVGNPGRIVRKDVAWSRNFRDEDIIKCGDYTNLTKE
jgi:acetyltransferase-like isoleucine patch superfamily enzyme